MPAGVAKSTPPEVAALLVVAIERSCTAVAELWPGDTSVASPKSVNEAARTADPVWKSDRAAKSATTKESLKAFIAHLPSVKRVRISAERAQDRALDLPLAARAVVAATEFARMVAPGDRRAALVARLSGALLDPDELPSIEREARPPRSTLAIAPQEVSGDVEHVTQRIVVEIRDASPRPHTREKERLVLDLIPDPRDGALVEESGGDVAFRSCLQPAEGLDHVEAVRDHVGAELRHHGMERELARGHELDHWRRLARRDVFIGGDDDARIRRFEPPALAGPVHVPHARHAHVGVEHDVLTVGLEGDHEVLPVRLHGLDRAPDDPALRSGERDLRCDDVESGDDATRERAAEHRRGAVDRVALRHAARVSGSRGASARNRPRAAVQRGASRRPVRRRRSRWKG